PLMESALTDGLRLVVHRLDLAPRRRNDRDRSFRPERVRLRILLAEPVRIVEQRRVAVATERRLGAEVDRARANEVELRRARDGDRKRADLVLAGGDGRRVAAAEPRVGTGGGEGVVADRD